MNWPVLWKMIKSNPYFVAAWTGFVGFIGPEIYTAVSNHNFDWSPAEIKRMIAAGVGAAFLSLWHLYAPSPTAVQKFGTDAK